MALQSSIRQFLSGTRKDASSKPPYLFSIRSSTTLIVLTVNLAIFTDIFFYALVIPVIPFSLTTQVGIPDEQVQHWTSILLAVYSVALLVGSPLAGLYADHTSSRRWPLLIGLVALAGSTLLLAFGNSIGLLVLGRLFQGFSAAIVWSVGCALLVDTMDSAVGVAMGYVNISMSVGLLIAPVIGGAVYGAVGYYPVYYIAFGVVAVDVLLRLLMIEKKVARQWIKEEEEPSNPGKEKGDVEKAASAPVPGATRDVRDPVDVGGAQTAAGETTMVEAAEVQRRGNQTGEKAEENPAVVTPSPGGSPRPSPKVFKDRPVVVLLRSPRILAALYGLVVEASIMMGFDSVLPLFVQRTFDWNSTAAGILFLALFVPGFVSPFVGWIADRHGTKWLSLAGFTPTVPILISLRFVTGSSIQHKILLGFLLGLLGLALAFSNTPLMAEISYVIEERAAEDPGIFGEKGIYGLGYGLFTMAFALGGTIGPLWAGYVVASAGWGTMTWSFAIWAASGAVVIFFWLGGSPAKKRG